MGVIFNFNYNTNAYEVVFEFDGSVSGSNPQGGLLEIGESVLYGTASKGGANDMGVLFKFDLKTSIYTKLIDFDGVNSGSGPNGSLIMANDGNIYGTTYQGGDRTYGTIYQYNLLSKQHQTDAIWGLFFTKRVVNKKWANGISS